MSTEKALVTQKYTELAQTLDQNVLTVLGSNTLGGFEKAYTVANATIKLKENLTPEYMKPIMALMGTKLGFKTDRDEKPEKERYSEEVVKNCLIEAVLTGVQPMGNQFNIISGSCYITKEGFGYMLKNVPGLHYEIVPDLPRINPEKTAAACKVKIYWSFPGSEKLSREVEFPIKMNAHMGSDAVLGKATRKARAWLFNTVMNTEISDGDITDIPHTDMSKEGKQASYEERIAQLASDKDKSKEEAAG